MLKSTVVNGNHTGTTVMFIQPLLDAGESWAGFLIESSHGTQDAPSFVQTQLSENIAHFDARLPWFVPEALITAPAAIHLPCIPLFTAQPGDDSAQLPREREAAYRQRRQALGLLAQPGVKLPGSGEWEHLLISCGHARSLPPFSLFAMAGRTHVAALDVHTLDERQWALKNGCGMTTGEYLIHPYQEDKKADIGRLRLLELLSLIVADADTPQLEAILRQEAKLSYSLLRLVNSAAIAPRTPITTFGQAINLLGRRQLQRWLQLLVYADAGNSHINPLLPKAASRGRLCERLAHSMEIDFGDADAGDTAFMIGAFSLLDTLLNMRMSDILQHLPLPRLAQDALGERSGTMGILLAMLDALDRREIAKAEDFSRRLPSSAENILQAQFDALAWASKIHPS